MMANQEGYPSELQFPSMQQAQEIPDYPPPAYSGYSTDQPGRENTEDNQEPEKQSNEQGASTYKPENTSYTKETETQSTEPGSSTDKLGRENTAFTSEEPETQSTEPGSSTDEPGREDPAYTKEHENQSFESGDAKASSSSNSYPESGKLNIAQAPSAPMYPAPDYHGNNDLYGHARPGPTGMTVYNPNQPSSTRRDEVVVIQPMPGSTVAGLKPPPDYLCLSWCILWSCAWWACCWPCAIAGVVYSHKARQANSQGNWISAEKNSRRARNWACLCVTATVFFYAFMIILIRVFSISSS